MSVNDVRKGEIVSNNGICLIGNGGHARAVEDVIYSLKGYSISLGGPVEVDNVIVDSRTVNAEDWVRKYRRFVLGVGQIKSAQNRIDIVEQFSSKGVQWPTIISPHAYVSPHAKIGQGTVIMHGAVVNARAVVGDFCIVNSSSVIEHDAVVYGFCHISTGAVVNGGAKVGRECFIGSNAVVLQGIKICPDTVVGAGSVVCCDITEPHCIYRGNPAGRIK